MGARPLDDVHTTRRRGLLDLDANVVIIRLDPEADQPGVGLQASMAHHVVHQFADREPGVIRAPVERWRRDCLVQGFSGKSTGGVVHGEDHFTA